MTNCSASGGRRRHETVLTSRDGVRICVHTWPVADPRGVVQITHGMGEHALRYAELADALNAAGWAVVAQDHRGHGASAASTEALGQIGADGWAGLVADIDAVREHSRVLGAGGPLVLLGHSMGSLAVQQYLPTILPTIDAVVLTGTAAVDLLEPAPDRAGALDPAAFNAPFVPARTDFDWLTRDEQRVDAYVADPLTGFGLDAGAAQALFAGASKAADLDALADVRADLPVYVVVGEADPVHAQLELAYALVGRYRAAGLVDVQLKVYEGARHELVHETNRDEVLADLLAWLDARFPPRTGAETPE